MDRLASPSRSPCSPFDPRLRPYDEEDLRRRKREIVKTEQSSRKKEKKDKKKKKKERASQKRKYKHVRTRSYGSSQSKEFPEESEPEEAQEEQKAAKEDEIIQKDEKEEMKQKEEEEEAAQKEEDADTEASVASEAAAKAESDTEASEAEDSASDGLCEEAVDAFFQAMAALQESQAAEGCPTAPAQNKALGTPGTSSKAAPPLPSRVLLQHHHHGAPTAPKCHHRLHRPQSPTQSQGQPGLGSPLHNPLPAPSSHLTRHSPNPKDKKLRWPPKQILNVLLSERVW